MKVFFNSPQELVCKGYQECEAASSKESISHGGATYNLAGKYSVKVEGKEKNLLILKAALCILFTLGCALCSSSIMANLRGRRVDVVYIKEEKEKVTLPFTDYKSKEAYAWRKVVFFETLEACQKGYTNRLGKHVRINNKPMLDETVSFNLLPQLPPCAKRFPTKFSVFIDDTFNVLIKRRKEGSNPVGVNMASRLHPGGGAKDGCPAQEESLCRRSNHVLGLQTQKYPLGEFGGIYCPHVQAFRNAESQGCTFMDMPVEVALVAIAFYDLREDSQDRFDLGLPLKGPIRMKQLQDSRFIEGTKLKIRNMLRIMAAKGHIDIVLGAFGCGAFENPPALISKLFLEVFQEDEFQGRFRTVDFAILKIFPKDQENVDAFSDLCNQLN
jgi:uncharacterized protein (TIGR02452 family)